MASVSTDGNNVRSNTDPSEAVDDSGDDDVAAVTTGVGATKSAAGDLSSIVSSGPTSRAALQDSFESVDNVVGLPEPSVTCKTKESCSATEHPVKRLKKLAQTATVSTKRVSGSQSRMRQLEHTTKMADTGTPQRPARGGKHPPKESSGLLMSVIRTLSASESNEQRDREKARLEREYRKSDQRLDQLITTHDQSLKDVMQIFGDVSGRLTESRKRIRTIKENLAACKHLLHCKRDELKERWLEGVEHKHVMLLLEQIDEVQDVGERVGAYVGRKHYLHATQLLVTSLTRLRTDLKKVEALKDVNTDLHSRKERLHEALIEEVHEHLYRRWTREVLSLRRQGSGRDPCHQLGSSWF
ncbi:hypothetical protein O3P69_001576 [Scylla paramamosain]|uniref:Exocyst complex component Sec8 n=1 Tax=Scylla paramamosain TaxID=85552 RepID=A0AAW0UZR5_SCYPA